MKMRFKMRHIQGHVRVGCLVPEVLTSLNKDTEVALRNTPSDSENRAACASPSFLWAKDNRTTCDLDYSCLWKRKQSIAVTSTQTAGLHSPLLLFSPCFSFPRPRTSKWITIRLFHVISSSFPTAPSALFIKHRFLNVAWHLIIRWRGITAW